MLSDEQLHILLIDDDKDDCNYFRETLLQISPIHKLTCGDNSEKIFNYIEETNPDIIFLDLNMPLKNGLQCLKELKAHDTYKNIPVIVYSISDDETNQAQCRALGAHHYLVKPYALINLANSLKKVLNTNWKVAQSLPTHEDFVINLEF